MSTGLSCDLVEFQPNEWYYILESGNAPKNAWDWRDFADASGPFPAQDAALQHLWDNHANPGSYTSYPYADGANKRYRETATVTKLIADAINPARRYPY